jgi:putative colanic acid biosynthesis UDP-glucose lipid carrier transferase
MLTSPLRLSSPSLRYVAWAIDNVIIAFCAWLVYSMYNTPEGVWGMLPERYVYLLIVAALVLGALSKSLYRSWRVNDLGNMLRSVATVWGSVIVIIMLVMYLSKFSVEISRVWFVIWSLLCLIALSLQRICAYLFLRWLRKRGYNFKTVLLVGTGSVSQQVITTIHDCAWSGLRIYGHIEPAQLQAWAARPDEQQPDEIWLCLPLSDEVGIRTSLIALRHSLANIRLVPDLFSIKLINHGVSEALGIPMLNLSASHVTGTTRLIKEIEDRVLALLILVLITPLMLVIAVAVKVTSKGPVFFRQKRNGWNGNVIKVYKFRTMYVHQEHDGRVSQATKNDPRITPLGAFLRRTSLDELPQFINVLQGRMSIVGPRPHALAHSDYYKELVPRYMLRHKVKPGITGWAQVHGFRGETETLEKMEKRVEYDLYYIEHISLWLDLQIIAMTIIKGFFGRNAY